MTKKENPDNKFKRIIIRTSGDTIKTIKELRNAGKGGFTKEIEQALLTSKIDLAVHSAKDLPTDIYLFGYPYTARILYVYRL